jgi:SAM-dependent methyltransferase
MSVNSGSTTLEIPPAENEGTSVPTFNRYGWMSTSGLDPIPAFIEAASRSPHWSLDIGCAYGNHTVSAVQAGARVVALDLDPRHLEILRSQTPPELLDRVATACGAFPDVELSYKPFGAILAARSLHFLDGPTFERAAHKLYDLLVPGGAVFLRAISPYHGLSVKFIPEYERRKAAGERWPGFVADRALYITDKRDLEVSDGPIHYFEPEILSRTFAEAGFLIERCESVAGTVRKYMYDGREQCVLVARRPIQSEGSV